MIPQDFTDYVNLLVTQKDKRHAGYDVATSEAKGMAVHTKGYYPDDILERYRPHEPPEVRAYRLDVWKPVTKSLSVKIINSVNKTLNPRYFSVVFPSEPISAFSDEKEQLGYYFNEDYGFYGSIWTWLKETFISSNFTDPNALVVIKPERTEDDTEIYKPLPYIYESHTILDYKHEEYYLIFDGSFKERKGKVIWLDRDGIWQYYLQAGELTLIDELIHDFGVVPAFFSGAKVETKGLLAYYESFIQGVRPHWDKVVELSSDIQGQIVNHLYLERWEIQQDCDNDGCEGGYIDASKYGEYNKGFNPGIAIPGEGYRVPCHKCQGTGKITNRGPFNVLTMSTDALNPDQPLPAQPAGYIDKNLDPLKEAREIAKEEAENGFKAVNLEILTKVAENQSGVAKAMDRTDADAFMLRVSSHYFDYVLPNVFYYTSLWMYSAQRSVSEIESYVSEIKISKPKEFNILTVGNLLEELATVKEVGASSSVVRALEDEIVKTRFSNNPQQEKLNLALNELRPFRFSADELMTRNALGAIRKEDLILETNLESLVAVAMSEDGDFLNKEKPEQLESLYAIINDRYLADNTQIPVNDQDDLEDA